MKSHTGPLSAMSVENLALRSNKIDQLFEGLIQKLNSLIAKMKKDISDENAMLKSERQELEKAKTNKEAFMADYYAMVAPLHEAGVRMHELALGTMKRTLE